MTKSHKLSFLAASPKCDARSMAKEIGITKEAAGMALLRLWRQGLLCRKFDPEDGVFFYDLTQKGQERLGYFHYSKNSQDQKNAS